MRKLSLVLAGVLMASMGASADIYVVSEDKADVRDADNEKAEVIGSLRKGMEINVSKIEGGFCRIDFMGVKGFVSVNDLKFKSRSDKSKGDDSDESVVDKTKGFVSNTSKKVADGVSGFTGKIFGKKKKKGAEASVRGEERGTRNEMSSERNEEASVRGEKRGTRNEERGEEARQPVSPVASQLNESPSAEESEYSRRVAEAEAKAANMNEEDAAGVIYLFDNHVYINSMKVSFNGNNIPLAELEILKHDKNGLHKYRRAVTKIIVKNPGRILLARDFAWYGKPYHAELTLDVADGDVYYVEFVHGMSNKLNLMSTKDGKKLLEKVTKDTKNWKVNPPQCYEE